MDIPAFENCLLGAWRVSELTGSRPANGLLTLDCPRCTELLDIATGLVQCAHCGWAGHGEPWAIAADAAAMRKKILAAAKKSASLPLWTLEEVLSYEPDPQDEIWPDGILSAGERTAMIGAPGVGKSRIALQAAIATILGKPFLGWETRARGKRWLFLQTENSARRLKADLRCMVLPLTREERALVNENLRILRYETMEFGSICMVEGHPDRLPIMATLDQFDPAIVVVDPLRDAGRGDLNKDECMTETCAGISAVIRSGNPRRVPLIIHHGRTGVAEAGKVWGDDAGSFGRNSKALYGWTRSQINIAPAGIEWPDTIIFGCGKNSNGPRWDPFAARLDPRTMTYHRLEPSEFDLQEWAASTAGNPSRKPRPNITPEMVLDLVTKSGGRVKGGLNCPDGLSALLRKTYDCSREIAQSAIESALGLTIKYIAETPLSGRGRAGIIYVGMGE